MDSYGVRFPSNNRTSVAKVKEPLLFLCTEKGLLSIVFHERMETSIEEVMKYERTRYAKESS